MATLISPGVSVTVSYDDYFIPAAAPTVPLFFIATKEEKTRPDGLTPAEGTLENNVVRTVTSKQQAVDLYGYPRFLSDSSGNPQHGDARNEYGLFALNQFLGVGNRAFVIRADVDLDDDFANIANSWVSKTQLAAQDMNVLAAQLISEYNSAHGYVPVDPNYKVTITKTEFLSLAATVMSAVYERYSFRNIQSDFETDVRALPILMYENGFQNASTGDFLGLVGYAENWVVNHPGSVVPTEMTPTEAQDLLEMAAASFQFTVPFLNKTRLGANDAARRVAIATALQASVNSNTEIRSDVFDYNIIVCPGYPELADEMVALSRDIKEEAFVIGSTPMNMNPDDLVSVWSISSQRQNSPHIAYYYPHGIASNLDGTDVMCDSAGIALRVFAYSDSVSELWFAPAGVRRGNVDGVTSVGYVKGNLGSATTFVETNLNEGQRDNMYKYFTNINPITRLPGRGLVVYGQKTSDPAAHSMDRVNVSRLIKYIKRQLRQNLVPFLFEPNDKITRDSVKAMVDGFLGEIMARRGLEDFAVRCDASNNFGARIDRNELWVDIAIVPQRAIEFIHVPIVLKNSGAKIG